MSITRESLRARHEQLSAERLRKQIDYQQNDHAYGVLLGELERMIAFLDASGDALSVAASKTDTDTNGVVPSPSVSPGAPSDEILDAMQKETDKVTREVVERVRRGSPGGSGRRRSGRQA